MNVSVRWMLFLLCLIGFACGDDDQTTAQPQSGENNENLAVAENNGDGCFTDEDCTEGSFCEALDPVASPEGNCAALGSEGASCVFGTQCAEGLVCAKEQSAATGQCLLFPSDCQETPNCDCAIALCASLAGSSCSAGSTQRPSITLSCAGGIAAE